MKKICLVIPSLESGGMERVMSELSHYFCSKSYYEVHLVLYGKTRKIFYKVPSNLIVHRPEFIFNDSRRLWNTIKTIWFLRKKIKEIAPYTILSFGEMWNSLLILSTLGLKYPIFVSDRSQPDKSFGWFQDKLRILLYPKSRGIICQTKTAKDINKKKIKNSKIHVIGNPIRAIEVANDHKENIILSVGRLIDSKHHDELIEIFAEINPPDWKLVIVGDDSLKHNNKLKLEALIQRFGMKDRIVLTGARKDVDSFYKTAKIFAFTSSSEGFPNVIGEAMSAGLPIVSYDCVAGPRDLINHGINGFLVEVGDKSKFKYYLKQLIGDSLLRLELGSNGKEIIKQYSLDGIGKKFENIIVNEIIND